MSHYVLYDDECSLCTFQMRLLTWLDWFGRLSLVPISSPKVAEMAPTLTAEELSEAIHCLAENGKIYRGARCIRFVGFRLPLLVPVALFLWIPGVIFVAEKVYMAVSRNRQVLSRIFGCKGACKIMPARSRVQDEGVAKGVSEAS